MTDCIEWTGAVGTHGYGRTPWDELAHRAAYRQYIGPIPEGMQVCHHCDNRLCYNPEHLFLGTNSDNQRDSVVKGRHRTPRKLTATQAREIREDSRPNSWLATIYGVSPSLIGSIKRKEAWQNV